MEIALGVVIMVRLSKQVLRLRSIHVDQAVGTSKVSTKFVRVRKLIAKSFVEASISLQKIST